MTDQLAPPPPPLAPAQKRRIPNVAWGLIAGAAVAGGIVFVATRDDESNTAALPTFDFSKDGSDFQENAEEFIEGTEVATQAGTTFTDAECTEPDKIEVGHTFTCTAVDADNATWDFNLEVTGPNSYEITDGAPRP